MRAPAPRDLLNDFDQSRLTRRYWFTFALIVLQLVCEVLDFFVVAFIVSAIAPQWHLSFGQTTIILLSAGLGSIGGALLFGMISDRFGRKIAVVGGGILYSAAAAAIALVPDGHWGLFALLRLLVGAGYGGAGSSQFALVGEYTPTRLRTMMSSSLGIPGGFGVLIGSLIVAHLFPFLGWRGVAALGGLPIFVALAIAWVAPESPRWLLARGHTQAAARSMRRMLGRGIVGSRTARLEKPATAPVRSISSGRRFWLVVLPQLGIGTAFTGVLLWGPTILSQALAISPQHAAGYFVWISIAGILGRCLFVYLPIRIGRVRSGMLIGYGGAMFLLLAAGTWQLGMGTTAIFPILLLLGEIFYDGGYSNLNPYAAELYPVRSAALGMGLSSAAGGIGKMAGPLALGLIAGSANLITPVATAHAVFPAFLFLAACCLIAGLAFTTLGVETHGRPLQAD